VKPNFFSASVNAVSKFFLVSQNPRGAAIGAALGGNIQGCSGYATFSACIRVRWYLKIVLPPARNTSRRDTLYQSDHCKFARCITNQQRFSLEEGRREPVVCPSSLPVYRRILVDVPHHASIQRGACLRDARLKERTIYSFINQSPARIGWEQNAL